MPVVVMPLANLVFDASVQPRVGGLDARTVGEYREVVRSGGKFPPVRAFGTTASATLSRGFHRCEAYDLEGAAGVEVDLRPGTPEDARWDALGSNRSHGLPRSRADRAKAVETAVLMRPEWTDHRLAEHVGVSRPTVTAARARLEAVGKLSNCPTREGRDGKTYTAAPTQHDAGQADGELPENPGPPPDHQVPARRRPKLEVPGPFDDLLTKMTGLAAAVSRAMNEDTEDGRRLREYLAGANDRLVYCRDKRVDGKQMGWAFTGLKGVRHLVKLANKYGKRKKLTAEQIRAAYKEARDAEGENDV